MASTFGNGVDKVGQGQRRPYRTARVGGGKRLADFIDRRRQQAGILDQHLIGEHRLGRAIEKQLAAADHQCAVGPLGDKTDVVRDHQDRGAVAFAQPCHQAHELLGALMILTNGRFVEHEQVGFEHQHGGNAQAPAFPQAQAEG